MSVNNKIVSIHSDSTDTNSESHIEINHSLNSTEVIEVCRKIMNSQLKELVHSLFDNTDDALFELADKAETNSIQCKYFDAMRIVRFKRQEIEDAFNNNIIDQFHNLRITHDINESLTNISIANFSLMQECDLEETLAIDGLIGKVNSRQRETLFALEQRVASVLPDLDITIDNNPFGPQTICNSFKESLSTLDVEIKIKLIIYKLFDKHVISEIGSLYNELNTVFINAGVLPKLKHDIKKSETDTKQNNHLSKSNSENSVTAPVNNLPVSDQNVLQTIQGLLTASRKVSHSAPEVNPQDVTSFQINGTLHANTGEVLVALNSIQLNTGHLDSNSATVLTSEIIKNTLASQFQSMENIGPKEAINPLDNDIIDVITMMFDFILEDHELPDAVIALVVRLQIPMLKVALIDNQFFASKTHPARKLLNIIAKTGVGLSNDNCIPGNILFDKLTETTSSVINDFKSDILIFETILLDIEQFLSELDEVSQQKTQKHIDEYKHREEVKLASDWVKYSINEQISSENIPNEVRHFLFSQWKDVLLKTYLELGENSKQWKKQIKFISVLLWSVEAKSTTAERQQLAGIILDLLDMLKSGLDSILYPKQGTEKIIAMLEKYHLHNFHSSNKTQSADEQQSDDNEEDEEYSNQSTLIDIKINQFVDIDEEMQGLVDELDQMSAVHAPLPDPQVEDIILNDYQQETENLPDDEYLQLARHLEAGRWIEFTNADNRTQRAKLAWKSELLEEFTFINWRFQVVADKTLNDLANDLQSGSAKIIEDTPIFDKALGAVVEGLKKRIA
ncbi:Thymidine phosphorylase [hydrothermal vent metagenome]|uniref:Thymidine phosphorylase n=1 Tax=hydrothermal vent metagenome TaxID=652676 RepID=A0A3B1AQT9_9ZZZZ